MKLVRTTVSLYCASCKIAILVPLYLLSWRPICQHIKLNIHMLQTLESVQFKLQFRNLLIEKTTLMCPSLTHQLESKHPIFESLSSIQKHANSITWLAVSNSSAWPNWAKLEEISPPMPIKGNLTVSDTQKENFTLSQQHQNDPSCWECKS